MSFADVLSEIPNLTPEERQEVARLVSKLNQSEASPANLRLQRRNGELLLVGTRVIRQSEVDAILADWP